MSAQPDLVIDVGMHVGDDTAFYLAQGRRVVAVEANPELAEAGRRRFAAEVAAGRLEILNLGIAGQAGFADFWVCESNPEWSSFNRAIASRDGKPHHGVRIPTARFREVLARCGTPGYLKIDIEGNDLLCLEDLSPAALPTYVSLESECTGDAEYTSAAEGLESLRRLRDLGYRRFKLIHQFTFVPLSLPMSLGHRLDRLARRYLLHPPLSKVRGAWRLTGLLLQRERLARRFGWSFPVGSSGPWGEETPGRWMGYHKAAQTYQHYRDLHFSQPGARPYSFWCDWHAKV